MPNIWNWMLTANVMVIDFNLATIRICSNFIPDFTLPISIVWNLTWTLKIPSVLSIIDCFLTNLNKIPILSVHVHWSILQCLSIEKFSVTKKTIRTQQLRSIQWLETVSVVLKEKYLRCKDGNTMSGESVTWKLIRMSINNNCQTFLFGLKSTWQAIYTPNWPNFTFTTCNLIISILFILCVTATCCEHCTNKMFSHTQHKFCQDCGCEFTPHISHSYLWHPNKVSALINTKHR